MDCQLAEEEAVEVEEVAEEEEEVDPPIQETPREDFIKPLKSHSPME